jgi:hypothetical protein
MQILTGVLISLATVALAFAGVLLALSPGRPTALRDGKGNRLPGSISERVFVEIGGVRQGMFVQSADPSNPVLLFLHGGPGLPQFFLTDTHPTGLERHFTVVWWEQRGSGLSFAPGLPRETMTLAQMIADTIAVAEHLRARFGQERIIAWDHPFTGEHRADDFGCTGHLRNRFTSQDSRNNHSLGAIEVLLTVGHQGIREDACAG